MIPCFVASHQEKVRNALFKAGGGSIGEYDECSFNSPGTGTFRANENAKPYAALDIAKLILDHTNGSRENSVDFHLNLETNV